MIFQCGNVEIDTARFSATRDGQAITVEPKIFDLLVFLIRHRDTLITREQLLKELWPNSIVLDNVLSNDIKLARAIFGDNGKKQQVIKTVWGRGYQFVGAVIEIGNEAAQARTESTNRNNPPTSANARLLHMDNSLPGILRPDSIAVLPFENRSHLEEDAFFTDGFHDELITQISRIKKLSTISRTSVMAYRDSDKSMRTIGSELNSLNIIEGGVQRAGHQIRINIQLINAAKDEHIWAETYTRKLDAESVFAIQSEISLAIANQLEAVLSPQEQENFSDTPTQNMAALEYFFRGRVNYGLATSEDFSTSIKHFEKAIELDPEFAEAHAQLALAQLEKIHFGGFTIENQAKLAEPLIERAISLKPQLSAAYEAKGFLEKYRGNLEASQAGYEKAIQLNPNNASALRMFAFMKSWDRNEPEQALPYINSARLIDPQNHHTLSILGHILMELERFDESQAALESAIDCAPNYGPAYQLIGWLNSWKLYRHDRAIKALRRALLLDPQVPFTVFFLASSYAELGESAKAIEIYERFLDSNPDEKFSCITRLRLHDLRREHDQVKQLLKNIIKGKDSIDTWLDGMFIGGSDVRYAHPDLAAEFFETIYPELTETQADLAADSNRLKLSIVYATMLHLSGKEDEAETFSKKIIPHLPGKGRYRFRGIGMLDACLYASMQENELAIQALREWRKLGGCIDLDQTPHLHSALKGDPEYQALLDDVQSELAEQRDNLARMETNGELAPIPF